MIKWIICALALAAVASGRPNSNSNSPSTQQQFRPKIDCPRLGDGNYVFGCSSTFYQCANGVAHAQKCHSDMVLDPEQNACDTPAKVAICQPEAMQNPTVVRAKDPFTCIRKPMGMYFIACNGAYAYCDGQGNRRDRSCPPGTALDESRGACDWPQNVPACNGSLNTKHSRRNTGYAPVLPRPEQPIEQNPPSAGAPGYAPQEPLQQDPPARPQQTYGESQMTPPILPRPVSEEEPLIPAQPEQLPAPTFDCSTRRNGIYPSTEAGCVNFFWKCANGQAFQYTCPEGMLFSVSRVECHRQEDIPECNGQQQSPPVNPNEPLVWKSTRPSQPQAPQQPSSLTQQTLGTYAQPQQPIQQAPPQTRGPYAQPQQPIQQTPPKPAETWCQQNNRQSGYHGEGCNAYYFYCNAGMTTRMHCPNGLFFDEETDACDHKNFIVACGGQKPTQPPQSPTLPPQQPYAPQKPAETWCQQNNRQNGYHGEGCNAYYFYCSAGLTTRMHCPNGLFFDEETDACDHKSLIVACGGQKPTQPPQSPTLPPQQPYAPQKPAETWCQQNNRQSGYHGEGCNAYYFYCNAGMTTRMHCPSGLFFDEETDACDHKNLIVACGGQKPTQPPQAPTLPPQQPLSPYGQQPVQQTPPKPAETWCQQNNRQSGYHGEGCNAYYFYCNAGMTTRMHCPSGLFFDEETDACDHKNLIVACGGQKPTQPPQSPPLSPIRDHGNFNSYYQPQQPQQPIQQSPPVPSFDCSGKADGFYEKGKCINNYIRCANQIAFEHACPSNLVFGNEMCDYKENCLNPTQPPAQQSPPIAPQQPLSSYGQRPQMPAPQAPPQTRGPYAQPQQPIQQTPPKPAETWCQQNNRQSGYHGEGCNAYYFYCNAGMTTRMHCPSGLFFDEETDACDHKNLIVACGGQKPTQPPQSPTLAPQQPLSPYGQQPVQQAPPKPAETWCQQNNRQSGYHGEGCNAYYFYCNAGMTTRMHCPSGLFFDEETDACDHKNLIVACGGQKPTQPPQSPTLPPQQPLPPYGQRPAQQPPVEDFCQKNNLVSGFHADGCSNYFFVCSAGSTTKISCSPGLWYDVETQQCDHKNFIVACGGQKPTQPPQAPTLPPQQPLPPYGQQPQQSPPAPIFDCSGKADGIYVEGCNSQYFACNGNHAHGLSCPAGTFYSTHTERCDFKEHVVECGGQVPTQAPPAQSPILLPQQPYSQPQSPPAAPQEPATPAPAWVAHPYQPSESLQQSPPATEPTQIESVNTNPCLSLNNGIYGRKCSRFFFVCTNSKTYDFICPKDQAFDVKTSKCAQKHLISTCSEFSGVPEPQQSPPAPQAGHPYGRLY